MPKTGVKRLQDHHEDWARTMWPWRDWVIDAFNRNMPFDQFTLEQLQATCIVRDGVHIHDLNATILHCLGIDHWRLTYKYRGLEHRLTGTERANLVDGILA